MKSIPAQPAPASPLRRVASLGILLAALAGIVAFVLTQQVSLWDFRNNLWAPAHLLVTGRSPYDVSLYFFNSNAVWLPPVVGALFPIGYLPEAIASNLWLLLSLAALGGLYALLGHQVQPPLWRTALALIGMLTLPPTLGHLALGQISALIGVLLLLGVRLVARGQVVAAGALLALALAKPQLLVLPSFGLAILAHQRDGWRGVLALAGSISAWALAMTLPLWLGDPGWVDGWWRALQSNPPWSHPSTLRVLSYTLGNTAGTAAFALFATGMFALHGGMWWRGLRQDEPDLIGLLSASCLMNLLVVPYVWTWDFVLGLPLLLLIWTRLRSRRALLVFGAGFGVVLAATVAVRLTTDGDDARFWFVPWGMLIVAALSLWAENLRQRSGRRSREVGPQ